MNLNWISVKDRKPKRKDGFNMPFISCLVWSCNPNNIIGGVFETCRWDVENDCWLESDLKKTWLLSEPYEITHFIDDINVPI